MWETGTKTQQAMNKMKLLIAAAGLLVTQNIHAQGLDVGIKLGASLNKISGKAFSEQFTLGYHLGGYATLKFGKKIAIQPEVLFNQVNTDTATSFSSVYQFNQITKVKLSYLSIPILLNYNLSNIFALQLGPQFGILISQNTSLVQNGKNAFKSGDFAMVGGAQVRILKFIAYGRYVIGLSNLQSIANAGNWKSQSIQLGVGMKL
jgi:hypothetical protein